MSCYVLLLKNWIARRNNSCKLKVQSSQNIYGAKPLSKPILGYWQLNPQEHTSVKFYSIKNPFVHKYAYENIVCEMAAILSRVRWVNSFPPWIKWLPFRRRYSRRKQTWAYVLRVWITVLHRWFEGMIFGINQLYGPRVVRPVSNYNTLIAHIWLSLSPCW